MVSIMLEPGAGADAPALGRLVHVVTTGSEMDACVAHHVGQERVAIDVETVADRDDDRVNPRLNQVLWVGLSSAGRTDVIPMGHPNGEFLGWDRPLLKSGELRVEKGLPLREQDYSRDARKARGQFGPAPDQLFPGDVFSAIRPILFDEDRTLIGHNIKFDVNSLRKYYAGELVSAALWDTMIAAFLVQSSSRDRLGLDHCLKRHLKYEMTKGVGKNVLLHSFADVSLYLYRDVRMTHLLSTRLERLLRTEGVAHIMGLEMDVLRTVCDMEDHGTRIDVGVLRDLKSDLEAEELQFRADAYRAAGRTFNVNSNPDKQRLLFEERGLKVYKWSPKGEEKSPETRTWADASVDAEALSRHKGDGLVDALLGLADTSKVLSTYVIPYVGGDVTRTTSGKSTTAHRDSILVADRVHAQFVQHGAETGRFSSRNPNLQNIPARKPSGKKIRQAFIPDEGHLFVQADYSQIEPRIIASLSKDPTMCAAYESGEDIYTALAEPLGLDRSGGKTLMLAMSYGVGPDKVATSLGVSVRRAKEILSEFDHSFPAVIQLKKAVVRSALRKRPRPYVTTVLGRRRYLESFADDEGRGSRQAFNTLIQGTAADVMKIALVRVHRMLPEGSHVVLTVHDEVVVTTPAGDAEKVAGIVKKAMEGIDLPALTIPLVSEVKIVRNWGEAK